MSADILRDIVPIHDTLPDIVPMRYSADALPDLVPIHYKTARYRANAPDIGPNVAI